MARWLFLFLPLLAAGAQTPASSPIRRQRNSARRCHADVWRNFFRNPHYKSIARGAEPPERTGCEGCHGPGAKHVAARGGKTAIIAFSVLQPAQVIDRCLGCHAERFGQVQHTPVRPHACGRGCTSCHSVHRAATDRFLLAKDPARRLLRLPCVGALAILDARQAPCQRGLHGVLGLPQPARHVLRFLAHGRQAPHGGTGARTRGGLHPLPYDKRGPFVFEHASVRVDGCETCHQPHGSTNARLLRRPGVFTVCLECHNGAGDFGTPRHGDPCSPPPTTWRIRSSATARYATCGSTAPMPIPVPAVRRS